MSACGVFVCVFLPPNQEAPSPTRPSRIPDTVSVTASLAHRRRPVPPPPPPPPPVAAAPSPADHCQGGIAGGEGHHPPSLAPLGAGTSASAQATVSALGTFPSTTGPWPGISVTWGSRSLGPCPLNAIYVHGGMNGWRCSSPVSCLRCARGGTGRCGARRTPSCRGTTCTRTGATAAPHDVPRPQTRSVPPACVHRLLPPSWGGFFGARLSPELARRPPRAATRSRRVAAL